MMGLQTTVGLKHALRSCIPLSLRMRLAIWLNRQRWFTRDYFAVGLVRDLELQNPKEFHKFLWTHHFMGCARWYDSEDELFSTEQMQPSRRVFFDDLISVIGELGLQPTDIRSILEVGCSLGYLLRHLETEVFPGCQEIVGIDIDVPAIRKGKEYLKQLGSKVVLAQGDMEDIDRILESRKFDLVYAAGVLSYLDEPSAARLVSILLRRTNKILAFAGLACTSRNNNQLDRSEISPNHEEQWIHNFAALVSAAGGRVVRSRWEGAKLYNLQTIHFVFAVPR
jgi:SAM-dependent methyltransferase